MQNILVFCEGKTEFIYIQELRKFLREMDIWTLQFVSENLNGIDSTKNYLRQIQNKVKKQNGKFDRFFIWLDYDIFKRESISDSKIKQEITELKIPKKLKLARKRKAKALLNYMNAEDFLILHCIKNKINDWLKVCLKHKHFENPMCRKQYEPLFRGIIPNYKKGEIPKDICFGKKVFEICIANVENKKIPFKSDIREILKLVLFTLK